MGRVVVTESVTLDGVMQAPGRPDEDPRDGFRYGGWAVPYNDPVMGEVMGAGMSRTGALLLGRHTYQDFHSFWPNQPEPNPITTVLNETRKYVASRTLTEPLPWVNSTLLEGDAVPAVARLREQPGGDIAVLGSGELVRSLISHDLVDEYTLLIHPLVLGSGRRLFPEDGPLRLQLVGSVTTGTGVVIATYRPDRAAREPGEG